MGNAMRRCPTWIGMFSAVRLADLCDALLGEVAEPSLLGHVHRPCIDRDPALVLGTPLEELHEVQHLIETLRRERTKLLKDDLFARHDEIAAFLATPPLYSG